MVIRICTTAALLLANSLTALPAKADVLPNLFAKYYCDSRALGMPSEDAVNFAFHESSISVKNAISLTIKGKKIDSDIYTASIEIAKLCPELLP